MFLNHFTNPYQQTLYPEGSPFFTPNGCNGARLKENLSHVNAVFADWDFKPKEGEATGTGKPDFKQFMLDLAELPTPSIIVESGNGWHLYWLLEQSIVVTDENRAELTKQVEGIHRFIHERYGSDSGAMDVLRLMRLPGHEHKKQPEHPFMVKVVEESDDRYTLEELMERMPPIYQETVVHDVVDGDDWDIRQVAIDAWAEKGDTVSFDTLGRMIWNGQHTATFVGRTGNCNFIATGSTEFPYKGNATTYSAGVLGISTKEAYKRLIKKYGERGSTEVVIKEEEFDWGMLMSVKRKGKDGEWYEEYIANDENIIRILNYYKVAKYDEFTNHSYLFINGKWLTRDDGADGKLYSWLVDKFPFLAKVTVKKIAELITFVQYRNKFDSAQNYINSLTWDGVPRLDTWLPRVFFVEEDRYYKDIGSKWLMGMVARILQPGCKFDNALVVHGGQGIGKSSVFLIIAGEESHVEFTDLKVREMQQDIQGKLIVEFAEAAIFSKADSESLKSIISRQTDTFRVPYERHPRDFPRRCVFAVTANNDDILKDATGGRRWWAVEVPADMRVYPPQRKADIHWLRENRDQLFAEAAVRFKNGEDFRNVDELELMKHQKSITATEQDEELFFNWYHGLDAFHQNSGVTIREAYCGSYKHDRYGEVLKEDEVSITKADEMRVGRILKKLGLEKKHFENRNVWVPGQMFDRNFQIKFKKTVHEF